MTRSGSSQLRTNNGGLATFTVDGKNQLTKVSLIPLTSDGNGNLIFDKLSKHSSVGYGYDDENRLQNWYSYAEEGGGDGTPVSTSDLRTEFVYDWQGRLRQRVEYTSDGTDWIWASATRYVYDGRRVIQERDGSNVPTVSYTRGSDLSGSLEGAGGIGGLLGRSYGYASGNWSTHNVYHADGNGNITYMVNSSQGLAASYRYDPFGNLISSSGSLAGANVYRFSSKEIHANSGLYYYGERFYDPNTQRWLNRDPLGEPGFEVLRGKRPSIRSGGSNRYLFIKNNSVNGIDPEGLTSLLYYYQCFDKRIHTTVDSQCRCICAPTSDEDCDKMCKSCFGVVNLNPKKSCMCIMQAQEGMSEKDAEKACKRYPDVDCPKPKQKPKEPDLP